MKFLDRDRILGNRKKATYFLSGHECQHENKKRCFVDALNQGQGSTIQCNGTDPYIEFENPELVELLVRKGVFPTDSVLDDAHIIPNGNRSEISDRIGEALRLIKTVDSNAYSIIDELIGSVACYSIPGRDGGSVSCCIGLIFLNPSRNWTVEYFAEMLFHEFVHNSLFLEDMVCGIFPAPDRLNDESALVTSVIRKTKRGFDKSYHSACVATGIMYLHHLLGNDDAAEQYRLPIQQTVREIRNADQKLVAEGTNVLTDNGRVIIQEVDLFSRDRDYALIKRLLT